MTWNKQYGVLLRACVPDSGKKKRKEKVYQLKGVLDLALAHDAGEEGVVAGQRGHLPVV